MTPSADILDLCRDRVRTKSVRCLQIVDTVYRHHAITLTNLCNTIREESEVLLNDITALKKGGFALKSDTSQRFWIEQYIPGYSLRLKNAEAAIVWWKLWQVGHQHLPEIEGISRDALRASCSILEAGLKKYHAASELLARHPVEMREHREVQNDSVEMAKPMQMRGLAQQVYTRLSIFESIEAGQIKYRSHLATLLGESVRTVTNHLNVMRQAGLEIEYNRDKRTYSVESLHTYLSRQLTRAGDQSFINILIKLFSSTNDDMNASQQSLVEKTASEKMLRSLRSIESIPEPVCI